jgi:hypothetical protein
MISYSMIIYYNKQKNQYFKVKIKKIELVILQVTSKINDLIKSIIIQGIIYKFFIFFFWEKSNSSGYFIAIFK